MPTLTFTEALAEVATIHDGVRGVDDGVREIIAALRMFGFPTSESCEGHLHRAKPYAWVAFRCGRRHVPIPDAPIGSKMEKLRSGMVRVVASAEAELLDGIVHFEDPARQFAIDIGKGGVDCVEFVKNNSDMGDLERKAYHCQLELHSLLDRFYAGRNTVQSQRLTLVNGDDTNEFQLQSVAARLARLSDPASKACVLTASRYEMTAFSDYLRSLS